MKKLSSISLLVPVLLSSSLAFARDLKSGVSGEDVKQWQRFLVTRNFELPINGKYGPATQRATVIFQKKWNLHADGIVGRRTLEKARALGYRGAVSSSKSQRQVNNSGEELRVAMSFDKDSLSLFFTNRNNFDWGRTTIHLNYDLMSFIKKERVINASNYSYTIPRLSSGERIEISTSNFRNKKRRGYDATRYTINRVFIETQTPYGSKTLDERVGGLMN